MFNSWIFYVVLFIIFQIAFLQLFKKATKQTTSIGALTIVVQIIAAISILVLSPFFDWTWPDNWLTWVLLAVALLLYAVNDRVDATVRKNIEISTDTMLKQVYRIFFFISGIVFLGYSFAWLKLLGALLIIIANMFLLLEKGKFKFNRYVILKIIASVIFAAAFTIDVYNSAEFNLPFFVFMSFGIPAVYLLIARQATPKALIREVKRKDWPIILACGITQGITAFSILRAYQFDKFIEVASLSAVYVVLNVFFSYVFLKERTNLVKKLIVASVIVGCIILITLAKV